MSDEPQTDPPEPTTYLDAKTEINLFKAELQAIAHNLSDQHNNKPLVIAIDELDRCRPSYAVELLEIAKHFFSVDGIVFVLAIDKSQLTHAIKALYGNEFDSIGYLRRFIDLDFQLPEPDRTKFMVQLLHNAGVHQFFQQNPGFSLGTYADVRNALFAFLMPSVTSLRQTQQAIYRLGLVLASLDSPSTMAYAPIAVMLIIKTIDPDAYNDFINSNMTDKEVSDRMFCLPGMSSVKSTREATLFDALLIIAQYEFTIANRRPSRVLESSLHTHVVNDAENASDPSTQLHAEQVVAHLENLRPFFDSAKRGRSAGFSLASQLIELFSNDLLQDDS